LETAHYLKRLALKLAILLAGLPVIFPISKSQGMTADEVMLSFRYQGVGNVYVTGLYDEHTMYLPVMELFNLLQIHYENSPGDFSLSGNFLNPDNPFRIHFSQYQVKLDRQVYSYAIDEFRIGEFDFFLSPKVFEEVFGLVFTVNLNALSLSLETIHTLPVEERMEREKSRERMEAREVSRVYYPLEYGRNRRVMGMGFADYNISGNYSGDNPSMNYTVTGGMELMGGDLQGNLLGSYNNNEHMLRSSNLRWRYVVRDNPWFSAFSAGQLVTSGLQTRQILGASVTNNPVEPRRIFESYVIEGTTEPDSEVELYLNNRLIDFRRADELGYYRFEFPLTYGTSRFAITIYTPTGEVQTIDRQLQIPFTFLPRGEIAYNIQGGLIQTGLSDGFTGQQVLHGDMAVGVTRWLTAKVGTEYLERETEGMPFIYGTLSARVFQEYLVNLDFAPEAFYRATASVIYPSSRNINVSYAHFLGQSFYNPRGAEEEIIATIYSPFNLFGANIGLRFGGEHTIYSGSSITRYRGDLNFRVNRLNFRFSYRDLLYISGEDRSFGQGQASSSVTYTFQRAPGVPVFVRGMFLRGSVNYNTFYNHIEQVNLQLSRSIRQSGRLIIGAGYDLISQEPFAQLGFTMDLNMLRSSTNVDYRNNAYGVRQSLRGSVGLDHRPERIVLDNRDQVGRAGASVILFVDNNNSGTYDEGDEIIPHNAIRLDRAAKTSLGPDGILRISQLQSYFRYNLEVNRNALPNPTLVPGIEQFSFVTDPNQYKRIEIAFYRTGIIDGTVYLEREAVLQPQGGVRLILTGQDRDIGETIRSFTDGGYYAMDLPPGRYTIEVDPSQLAFLNAYQKDGPLNFEIQALSEGDFVENLDIYILPGEAPDEPQPVEPEKPEPTEEQPAMDPPIEEEIPVQPEQILEEPEPVEEVLEEPEPVEETVPEPVVEDAPEEPEPTEVVAEQTADTHYIQVGIYATYGLADAARTRAEQVSGQPHYIKLHRGVGLHLVFSGLDNESGIASLEERLRSENFGEVFTREASDITERSSYHLRLRTFSDRESAIDYISEVGPALGMDLVLDYYETGNRHELRTESFGNLEKAMEAQKMLQGRSELQPVIVIRD
jgi:hypothetical protein